MLGNYYVGDISEPSKAEITTFLGEIRSLRKEFQQAGLFDASLTYYAFKVFSNLALLFLSVAILMLPLSQPVVVVSGLVLALFFQQSGWLSHDFLHHQVFKSRQLNNLSGFVLGNVMQGFSVGWWKSKHNTHHAAPNVVGIDSDVDTLPYLALDERFIDGDKGT